MVPKQNKKKSSNTQKKRKDTRNEMSLKENGALQDEIILVVAFVVSVLLFLSNFNLGGAVGRVFSGFIFGLIGVEAYILPFFVFFITAFHISNLGNKRAGRKIISAYVFFIALAALIQLITTPFDSKTRIFDYYLDSMNNRNGGGIIGGIFVMIFCNLFDQIATYIILIAIMLISITVITGKVFFTNLAKKGKASIEERREYQRYRKEHEMDLEPELEGSYSVSSRRPPKTFVIDQTNEGESANKKNHKGTPDISEISEAMNIKARRLKKDKASSMEEISVVNFNNTPENEISEKETDNIIKNLTFSGTVPGYEEELRSKFGPREEEVEKIEGVGDLHEVKNIEVVEEIDNAIFAEPQDNIHEAEVEKKEAHINEKVKSSEIKETGEDLSITQLPQQKEYVFPPLHLLNAPKPKTNKGGMTEKELKDTAMKLQSTLESFGVHVTITNASVGPAVTRYELQPEQGVKVSRITSLADDIKLNLAAADIRIEAPIPGKAAVGIEVPNKENSMVTFRELVESKEFTGHPSGVAFAVGKDIGGQTIITDIAKMPHLLIAGATGSGKSVCINTLIMSILYKSKPSDVRLIMVDPKVVELSVYNGIPHLLIPVVTDPKKASAALNWAVMEMTERYKKFADVGVRDLKGYNEKIKEVEYLNDENYQKLPQIVIIIDELADLMMVAPGEVEDAICRLAQLARACGIHLIIATQRPSVNVITGVIKANIPSRIAFAVSSAIDSRTILDGSGAEKLLGKGDMLFFPSGYPKPIRVQGAFVSDKEVSAVVDFLKQNNSEATYNDEVHDKINNAKAGDTSLQGGGDARDEYFAEAGKFIIEKDKASIGMLQRVYKIGFNRAARIMDQLADAGVVGPEEGTKPRKVLMSLEEFEQYLEEH